MLLKTKHFNEIEIDETKIISFKEGLPGFEGVKKFTLLYNGDESSPFKWLQSVDKPDLAFAVVEPLLIKKDYDITIPDEIIKLLDIKQVEDVSVYSVVVIPDDISEMTMNLKAPVIINFRNNEGMQIILDTDKYSVRHYILEELRRQGGDDSAGTDEEKK